MGFGVQHRVRSTPHRKALLQMHAPSSLETLSPPPEPRTREGERELLNRFAETRDPRLREEIVERFMPFARSLALRYRGGGEAVEDLVQVACVGLLKAI